MTILDKYTPLRFVLPFVAGIILNLVSNPDCNPFILVILGFCGFLCLLSVYYFGKTSYRYQWFPGFLAILILFIAGYTAADILAYKNEEQDIRMGHLNAKMLICRIEEKPLQKARSFSCRSRIRFLADSSGQWHQIDAGVMVYFSMDIACRDLLPGDIVLIRANPKMIDEPSNPGAFNFKRFMYYRQVGWQVFAGQGQFQLLKSDERFNIKRWAELCREGFYRILEKYGLEGEELALANGLILGNKRLLDQETIREFSNAGAMHVLSVSGLHVGIMFVLADRMLFILKRGRHGRKIQKVWIILIIWAYAFLTGLPPSVVRASLMFSLIGMAGMMNRSHEGINILAVAAFFQLWINPFEITQLGFQLSYLAVLGIFTFYRPLNEMFSSAISPVASIWSILAVSIAAQAATFPVAGYYFHFFPVYFLLTNLVVVPLAGIIIYLAFMVLVAGGLGIGLPWLALPLKWSLQGMLQSVGFIQSMPGSVIKPVWMNEIQVVLLYAAMASCFTWLVLKNRKGLMAFMFSIVLFCLATGIQRLSNARQAHIIVYHINKHTALEMVNGRGSAFLCDSSLLQDQGLIDYNVEPNRMSKGIKKVQEMSLGKNAALCSDNAWMRYPFLAFRGKTIAILEGNFHPSGIKDKIQVDIAIIADGNAPSLSQIVRSIEARLFIVDGSVPGKRADRYSLEAAELNLPCFITGREGAFVLDL